MAIEHQEVDWEGVYWQQLPRLYNFFRYRTGDNQTAQDLTAATFEKAWRFRHQYQCELGKFESWLFAIARRVAVDHLRTAPHHPAPLDDMDFIAADESIEHTIQKSDDFARLYALLLQLSSRDQELIALKYGAGLTNRAIAQITHLSESNVGTALYRIIKKLRTEWE